MQVGKISTTDGVCTDETPGNLWPQKPSGGMLHFALPLIGLVDEVSLQRAADLSVETIPVNWPLRNSECKKEKE